MSSTPPDARHAPGAPDARFAATRAAFRLPEGLLYLDGNSLGPLPVAAGERLGARVSSEWGERLIRGWNECGWMDEPTRLGDRIGRLIGAPPGSTVVGETLSIRVWQALAAALELAAAGPDGARRRTVLSDDGNFPSDLYMAEGLVRQLGRGHELRAVAPEALIDAIDDTVAALLVTHVDYRTGRLHDMAALTTRAHAHGVPVIWDLAHSTGAVPVDVAAVDADFAVGCTYKYLNAGPGAPAFLHVAPRLVESIEPALAGWLGHAAPFAFEPGYRPGPGIERMRVGTPPVLANAVLDAALDVWESIGWDVAAVRAESIEMSGRFVSIVEAGTDELVLASPRDPRERGSQVSFRHPDAYAIVRGLTRDHDVIGDFRAPDMARFAFAPLYLSLDEVDEAARRLVRVVVERGYDDPELRTRAGVT